MHLRVLLAVLGVFLTVFTGPAQEQALKPFVGRWEIKMKGPTGDQSPMMIIEIAETDGRLAGKIISTTAPSTSAMTATLKDVSVKGDEVVFVLEAGVSITFRGKKVGDRLEGATDLGGGSVTWTGTHTTKDKSEAPQEPEDQRALSAAMQTRDATKRRAALEKFLADFPESTRRDQAAFPLAMDVRDPKERQAALEKFLADYPDSTRKDQAHYQIASSTRDPDLRLAALEKFVVDFPKSSLAGQAYMSVFTAHVRKKPVDESKIQAVIDAYIESVPNTEITIGHWGTLNRRSDAYNTVADRLMVNDVMLDKALDLIQKAVASTTDKTYPNAKAMYLTTLGQVQFKRKEYDRAEESLKKAIATADADATGQAQLYLGKIYEVKGNSDAALDAYLTAAASTNSAELTASLEKAYTAKHGSLAGLHEKIDANLLARPKPFEAGRYESKGDDKGAVVLAELFTGSECRPCLAADLGFDGLIEHYPRQTVAVLEYHLHIPGPDPMTNSDTEQRQKYYGVNGTPTVLFDGIPSGISGGARTDALRNFNGYKAKIETRLARQPQVKLSSLSLKSEGDTFTVSGEVDASQAGAVAGKAKLRLALVEETVHYTGGNGIHFHHFVVRKMIGSSEGLPLQGVEGKTRFSESAKLSEVGVSLKEYLDNFEKNRTGFQWAEKLDQVNPKQLAVVAFVQNDETKEVLQSAFIH